MVRAAWLLLILLAPAPALPQKKTARKAAPAKTAPPPTPASKWPIETVAVEGLRHYTQEHVIAATGLRVGQLAGKEEFEAARDRLLATGLFETVGYRFAPSAGSSGYVATFQVVEVEPIYPVRFERLDVPDEEVKAWLRRDPFFGDKIPATKPILERHARAIEEYLATRNRKDKVIGKVVNEGPDRFSILFRPAAPEPVVAEVKFEGNEVLPSSALLNTFSGVAFGAVFREPAFRQMLDVGVRPLYEARGRIRVQWTKIQVEKAKTVEGLRVTVTVDEGPSFDLGEVKLAGQAPAKNLLKEGAFKSGELANFDEIQAGLERMKKSLRRQGYMHNEIQVERTLNDKTKSVDLTLKVEPGPQFTFGKLAIEGLDIHGEAAVKKMWALKEGQPFNADYPDYFLQRIREDGLFDDLGATKAATVVDEQAQRVAVTLIFRGASKGPGEGSPARGERRRR
ncbi:MAG: hypothetical protein HY013_05600 [Candidatus Solibacter usitatus]|nr:hypothetical protein [Candidatus Solibacter usitatus]